MRIVLMQPNLSHWQYNSLNVPRYDPYVKNAIIIGQFGFRYQQ